LSPRAYNERTGLCLACPVTSRAKGFRFEVPLPAEGPVSGVVLADQVRCLSWSDRQAQFIVAASFELLHETRERLAAVIGIE
jgi:mRNA interferase MazF